MRKNIQNALPTNQKCDIFIGKMTCVVYVRRIQCVNVLLRDVLGSVMLVGVL